ncbi:11966_t:CDS:2 [Ambispora leptoticha]|uniref:11966_t:CDS:1 n=1 Tax=Ambispora leptoticha TaxID=144679 RepID=A0A9N9AHC9_9GLOM|nr:11966_t:CDS:2 [Ambispora leptoticha]
MPYEFCQVCKRNNGEGRRHFYTKSHQERLKKVLEDQQSNYRKYKIFLRDLTLVQDINKQPDFACLFCEVEVKPKPIVSAETELGNVDESQFVCIHIFEHLATKQHHMNVNEWFKKNNVDRKLIGEFMLKKANMDQFQKLMRAKQSEITQQEKEKTARLDRKRKLTNESLMSTSNNSFNHNNINISLASNELNHNDNIGQNNGIFNDHYMGFQEGNYVNNKIVFTTPFTATFPISSTTNGSKNKTEVIDYQQDYDINSDSEDEIERKAKKPRIADNFFAANLTRIKVPPLKPGEGNVFMEGSIPPWMQDNKSNSKNVPSSSLSSITSHPPLPEIGPSLDAFLKAQKAEKKAKLNPNRVGADFDRASSSADKEWVPNFGRVWNSGTRRQSRKQFHRESRR